MEVKGISPVAVSNPIRDQHSEAATPQPVQPRQRTSDAGPPNQALGREIGGRLAQSLLQESGVEHRDIAKYKVSLDIDNDTGRVVAEIRDRRSGELVNEVPSRTLLRQAAMLQETLGTILDKPV